jgi:alkaline phosphatase D
VGRRNTSGDATGPWQHDGVPADEARVVQISDTHFAAARGVPPQWSAVLDWLATHQPDLLVHTGDIVFEDPDDDIDRAFAKGLLDQAPLPSLVIPGNHDIGFFGDEVDRPRRLATFRDEWGDDRFVRDLAGWRIVGADAYLLGTTDHDDWLRRAVTTTAPVLLFIHQPVRGEPADGWEMPEAARAAFDRATAGADLRVVASGHRHCSFADGRAVWAPSLTLTAEEPVPGADPRPGFVEHVLAPSGGHRHRVLRPWELT